MVRVRKGAVQIRFELLEFLYYNPGSQLRTYIWRGATTLSYDDFLKHLSYLVERDFVEETSNGFYRLTKKGRRIYKDLRDSLPSMF